MVVVFGFGFVAQLRSCACLECYTAPPCASIFCFEYSTKSVILVGMPFPDPLQRIAALIKAKRRESGLGVNAAAADAGINAATLSRLERRVTPNLPDSSTLKKLASWLSVSLEELLAIPASDGTAPIPSTPEVVEVHLRADRKLEPEKAKALAEMFKILYENAVKA
jgi:transcriptional regulator with XRE-family HTH domain